MAISPTVAHRELRLRLSRRRKELGIDAVAVAASLDVSRNHWSNIETGRRLITEEHLRIVFDLFEIDDRRRDELRMLRGAAKERGWWGEHTGFGADELEFFGLEAGCVSTRAYNPLIVNSLLQTPEYARAVISANAFRPSSATDRLVRFRMRRQRRLFDATDPFRLTVLLGRAALLQQFGGPEVQRAQLRQLASIIRDHPDTVEVRVLPFTAVGHGIFGAPTFHLLDFASEHLPTVGWHESVGEFRGFVDDDKQLRDLEVAYTRAYDTAALGPQESLAMIEAGG